jgi:hypothetical protein
MEVTMNEETNETKTTDTELDAVRLVVLAAYPDSVPELIQGDSVPALLASIEPARAAYARVAESVAVEPVAAVAPVVPAGGGSAVIDPGALPAAEKVRRGIAGQRR